MPETSRLLTALARLRRRYRLGLVAVELLRMTGYAVSLLVLYVLADFLLAFSPRYLVVLNGLLICGWCGALLVRLWPAAKWSLPDMARRSDRALGGRRREVLGAYEMARTDQARSALERYLVTRAIEQATARLRNVSWRAVGPLAALKRQARNLAWQVVVALLVLGVPWGISSVILTRIFFPSRDVPPYSRYQFAVTPAQAEVLYGGTLEVQADITGPAFQEPVRLVTRRGKVEHRTTCFQEGDRHYSQRLEKVVQPLEFCFALGRARSHWYPLSLILDPQIAAVQIRVQPPAYSRKPARTFLAGEERLADLKGSAVEMDVTCNRPLARGELTFRPAAGQVATAVVAGESLNPYQLRFHWTLSEPAQIDVAVLDVRGARNQKEFVIRQDVVPDLPPELRVNQPPPFALATPRARIPLSGTAEDDLELRRVEWVQTLVGFRDRAVVLDLAPPQKRLEFERELDLAKLGVEPGQELEFYLEAVDSNPEQLGIGASETVRLHIISEDDYARQMRARLRTEDFLARYRSVVESLRELQATAEQLEADLKAGRLSRDEINARWAALADENRRAAQMARQVSDEMALFELEGGFNRQVAQMADTLEEQQDWLDQRPPFDEGLLNTVANLLDRIGRQKRPLEEEQLKAEELARISRLMEEALRFTELLRAQESLVRRLEREVDTTSWRDAALREHLRDRQADLAVRLDALRQAIREKAAQLDDTQETLRQTALHFSERLENLEIIPLMRSAAHAADNSDKSRMLRDSRLALERMEQLLSDCQNDAFGGMSKCKLKFDVRRDLQRSLQQMLDAWSMGTGEVGDSGYSMQGYSPLNVPSFGPSRASMSRSGAGGDSGGAQPVGQVPPDAREQLQVPDRRDVERGAVNLDQVPEKYRDALKKYYEGMEKRP